VLDIFAQYEKTMIMIAVFFIRLSNVKGVAIEFSHMHPNDMFRVAMFDK
jgi:hypothetical protein